MSNVARNGHTAYRGAMAQMTVAGTVPAWTLPDKLRKAREHAGLSQSELQSLTGISRRTIVSYEGGGRAPRRPQLVAWAVATGVPLWWLEGDDGGPGGRPRQDSNLQPTGWTLAQVRRGFALHNVAA